MTREFSVFLTPSAERVCKKLPRTVADFVSRELTEILRVNAFAGKPLVPLFSGREAVSRGIHD